MTVEEKRAKIKEYCNGTTCAKCELAHSNPENGCFSVPDEDAVKHFYKILFGDDEPMPDQHFITAEPIEDDADTIIKIKSSRAIDSITIYFKEEK